MNIFKYNIITHNLQIQNSTMFLSDKIQKEYIENKGYGFIANSNIKKNDIILIDNHINTITNSNYIVLDTVYELLRQNEEVKKRYELLCPFKEDKYFCNKSKLKKEIIEFDKITKSRLSQFDIDTICIYIEKYKRNAFNIAKHDTLNKKKDKIVPGVFLNGAVFNHSCDPNVSCVYRDNQMYYITNKNIKKGEELCISYINVCDSTQKRQKELLERYGFKCECNACTKELFIK